MHPKVLSSFLIIVTLSSILPFSQQSEVFAQISVKPSTIDNDRTATSSNLAEISDLCVLGQKFLLNQNYAEAEQAFAKASQLCSGKNISLSPKLSSNYGMTLLRLGKIDEALQQLNKAAQYPDAPIPILINLASVYQKKEQFVQAKLVLEKALISKPSKDQIESIKTLLELVNKQICYQQSNDNKLDYFSDFSGTDFTRWNQMPIKVFIEPSFESSSFKPEYVSQAKEAFAAWSAVSDNLIKINFINDKKLADINLSWTTDAREMSDKDKRGGAQFTTGPDGRLTNTIKILLFKDSSDSDFFKADTANLMANVIYHEIGHSLGLGHSLIPQDVMYQFPEQDFYPKISTRDKNTLIKLYTVPFKANAGYLNAQGIKQASCGHEEQAIITFQEALMLVPSNNPSFSILENLIKAEYSLILKSIKQNDLQTAESRLNQTIAIAAKYKYPKLSELVQTNENILCSMGKKDKADFLKKQYPVK